MKPEIVNTQSWRYKTIVVLKGQQQTTMSKKDATADLTLDGIPQAIAV